VTFLLLFAPASTVCHIDLIRIHSHSGWTMQVRASTGPASIGYRALRFTWVHGCGCARVCVVSSLSCVNNVVSMSQQS
jgi:hypothetical protein